MKKSRTFEKAWEPSKLQAYNHGHADPHTNNENGMPLRANCRR